MKKKIKVISFAVFMILIIIGIMYIKKHTYTLSGNEQIQPVTGTVKVRSQMDMRVIFIDCETGVNHTIPYITHGMTETIKLEKGKWYHVETGKGLTMSLINIRIN